MKLKQETKLITIMKYKKDHYDPRDKEEYLRVFAEVMKNSEN